MLRISLKYYLLFIFAVALSLYFVDAIFLESDKDCLVKMSPLFDSVATTLRETTGKQSIDVDRIGGYLDQQFVWHLQLKKEKDFTVIERVLNLRELEKDVTAPLRFWTISESAWWNAKSDREFVYFSSPGFDPNKHLFDGEHFFVAFCRKTMEVFVWHKMQFF